MYNVIVDHSNLTDYPMSHPGTALEDESTELLFAADSFDDLNAHELSANIEGIIYY